MIEDVEIEFESRLMGIEPTGCVHCREGAKMVLLVTGVCGCDCYYCPLSEKKVNRDVVYANELLVWSKDDDGDDICNDGVRHTGGDHGDSEKEELREFRINSLRLIIDEARSISATGTGITGGDPLAVPERTLRFIRLLKKEFGPEHHIHLYTASVPMEHQLRELKEAGLDEIRFHLMDVLEMYTKDSDPAEDSDLRDFLSPYLSAILISRAIGLDTGVEIPVIPGQLDLLKWLIPLLEDAGSMFLNLNELEFSPTNAEELVKRGFQVRDDISSAVAGSRELAYELMGAVSSISRGGGSRSDNLLSIRLSAWHSMRVGDEIDTRMDRQRDDLVDGLVNDQTIMAIHFCSSQYKDAGQLRRRLHRRAVNVVQPHEHITEDDTLLLGIIEPAGDLHLYARELMNAYEIPEELIHVNVVRKRVEVAPWVLPEIASEIGDSAFIVEEYPTADRLEVEREKLLK